MEVIRVLAGWGKSSMGITRGGDGDGGHRRGIELAGRLLGLRIGTWDSWGGDIEMIRWNGVRQDGM